MHPLLKIVLFSATTIILLTQCRTAKMALHNEQWPAKEEYKVEGKRGLFSKEKLQFGEYYTTQVKRSWTKGSNCKFGIGEGNINGYDYTNLISLDYINRKQTIRFSLTDASNRESEVFCVSNFNTSEVQVGNRPNSLLNIGIDIVRSLLSQPDDKYYVQIYTKADRPWELIVDNVQAQMKPKEYGGYLSQGNGNHYTIVPVRDMEGKDGKPQPILFGSVGFEFRNKEGKPVAAVSKIDRGIVYLQKVTAKEKFLLANACAALVLQEMISG